MPKCCGGGARRNKPRTDSRGNPAKKSNSLEKYAFLHPNQRRILEAQKAAEEAEKSEG